MIGIALHPTRRRGCLANWCRSGWLVSLLLACSNYDIKLLGIGRHRHFGFHSALIPFLFLAVVRKIRQAKPVAFVPAGVAIGCSLAFGIHLLIDVFQPHDVRFPLIGSAVNDTLLDDNLWLLANSIISHGAVRPFLQANPNYDVTLGASLNPLDELLPERSFGELESGSLARFGVAHTEPEGGVTLLTSAPPARTRASGARSAPFGQTIVPEIGSTLTRAKYSESCIGSNIRPDSRGAKSTTSVVPLLNSSWSLCSPTALAAKIWRS